MDSPARQGQTAANVTGPGEHRMKTLAECLIALRTRAGSERKAATLVGVTNTAYSDWTRGRSVPKAAHCARIAQELGLDPAYVTALAELARPGDNDAARAMWQRVAAAFGKAAAVAFFTITPPPMPAWAGAAPFDISVFARPFDARNTHCMPFLRRVLAWLRGWL
jgi:transcriptional regulator with XRE-family HTH domain